MGLGGGEVIGYVLLEVVFGVSLVAVYEIVNSNGVKNWFFQFDDNDSVAWWVVTHFGHRTI